MMYYTVKEIPKKSAKARMIDVNVSVKDSLEVARFLRGMKLQDAKDYLQKVIEKKAAIPFRRHLDSVSHRKGIGPGRYPVKVSKFMLQLLENVEANAENQDLDTDNLIIHSLIVKKGRTVKKYIPRAQGRSTEFFKERVHFEIIVREA
ncbi:MAG: 50S ribosomal protein L22 [Thermoplasmata archaeon]